MKNRDIILHINYCEQGQTLAETCRRAAQWGFDGIEFRRQRRGLHSPNETFIEYLDVLEDALSTAAPKTVIFGSTGPNLMQADADARQSEVDSYIAYLDTVHARFGVTLFNTRTGALFNPNKSVPTSAKDKQGSGIARAEHYEWATDGFQQIGKFAESRGITLAFETHFNYLHDLPAPAKKLVDAIDLPTVGVNFDFCNMQYYPDPVGLTEAIDILDDHIFYVHLKNLYRLPSGDSLKTSLAAGQINNRDLLRQVFQKGYNGPIGIEAPRLGDREQFAQEDLAYTKALLADLER